MKTKSLFFIAILLNLCFIVKSQNVDSIDIIHYNINLNVNNKLSNQHIGYTDIKFKILSNDYHKIKLQLKNQIIDSAFILPSTTAIYIYNNPNIIFNLNNVNINDTLTLRVYYHGGQVIEQNSMAWGGIHYNNGIIYTLNVAFHDYPHSYARSWFVAKDVFDDKATYSFHIETNKDVQAICGGVLDSISENISSNTYHYTIPQRISPYLCSMTIANFHTYSDTIHSIYGNDIPLTVRYRYSDDSLNIRNNFINVPLAFNALEKTFGKFRFNKVGYCLTPLGSMEHVDNISLAQNVVSTTEMANQSNIIHELAHSWFGNLITCSTQEDMWLNEGWTSFTTRISFEGMYGIEKAKEYFRNENVKVIRDLPKSEGFLAVYGIDSTMTYSSTVYDKGAMVVQTLRGMIGDSLFSIAVKDMIDSFAFKNINTIQVRDFLSNRTNINLTPFFNCFVFNAGYVDYDIIKKDLNNTYATISIRQKAYPNKDNVCSFMRLPITFMDSNYNKYKTFISINGDSSTQTFSLPFVAKNAFLDIEEEIMDLTTDNYKTIKNDGTYDFDNTYFKVTATNINDSLLLRPTLHWLGEDTNNLPQGISRISSKHYWTIEGLNLNNANLEGNFYYELNQYLYAFDSSLLHSDLDLDSLIMLYRKDKTSPWIALPTNVSNLYLSGYVSVDMLSEGEYLMAIGDKNKVSLYQTINNKNDIEIYPNPCKNKLVIKTKTFNNSTIKIYATNGQEMFSSKLNSSYLSTFNINLKRGNYIVSIQNKTQRINKILIIN